MKTKTLIYKKDKGWSSAFPELDSKHTLILIFGSPSYINDQKPIQKLSDFYKESTILGCSSAGEILQDKISDETLVVSISKFEQTTFTLATETYNDPSESYAIGKKIALNLKKDDLKFILILSAGLNINGSKIVNGVNDHIDKDIIITGGLAGDGYRFQKTWVIDKGKLETNVVTAVGFYGDAIEVGSGSYGGWNMFGPDRIITRSKDNVLYEIDGKPALSLYKNYLGERANELPASALLFPLAIRKDKDDEEIVRTILSINEDEQSMTFAGDVPQGWHSKLMRANMDNLIDGASKASQKVAKIRDNGNDVLVIAISCVGRRLVLRERSEEEIEAVIDCFPKGIQLVGFYSYGEISSEGFKDCKLHNQTMTLTTISENIK